RTEDGNARRCCAGDVDVGGVTARRTDGLEGQIENGALARVGLTDQDGGALLLYARGEVVGAVEPQRIVIDPGIDGHLAQRLEGGETRTAQRCGRENDFAHACTLRASAATKARSPG